MIIVRKNLRRKRKNDAMIYKWMTDFFFYYFAFNENINFTSGNVIVKFFRMNCINCIAFYECISKQLIYVTKKCCWDLC